MTSLPLSISLSAASGTLHCIMDGALIIPGTPVGTVRGIPLGMIPGMILGSHPVFMAGIVLIIGGGVTQPGITATGAPTTGGAGADVPTAGILATGMALAITPDGLAAMTDPMA